MSFIVPAIPYIMAAGTAISGIGNYNNTMYQSQVATQNADLLKQQADRETFAANQDIQDQDQGARAEIANMLSEMSASGLTSTSGSMMFRRAGAESLALRDRERLGQKRDIQLENTKRQEADMRSQAKQLKKGAKLGLLTTLLSVPTSFLSGSSMVNEYTKGRLALSDPSMVGR
jgi:hypothetical protein